MTYTDAADTYAQDEAEPGKISQRECNYRMGTPVTKCGNCVYYNVGDDPVQYGRCDKVTGSISTYGVCDVYYKVRSPWRASMTDAEFADFENWYAAMCQSKGIPFSPSPTQLTGTTDRGPMSSMPEPTAQQRPTRARAYRRVP